MTKQSNAYCVVPSYDSYEQRAAAASAWCCVDVLIPSAVGARTNYRGTEPPKHPDSRSWEYLAMVQASRLLPFPICLLPASLDVNAT